MNIEIDKHKTKYKSDKKLNIVIKIIGLLLTVFLLLAEIVVIKMFIPEGGVIIQKESVFQIFIIIAIPSILVGVAWMNLFKSYSLSTFINRVENEFMLYYVITQCIYLANIKGWDMYARKLNLLFEKDDLGKGKKHE